MSAQVNADFGVIYVATDDDLVREAVLSAKSVKQHNNVPITLVTNSSARHEVFDNYAQLDNPQENWLDKIAGMMKSPYERTLYLDTDTYIAGNFTELYAWLDRYDFAAFPQVCHNTDDIHGIPDTLKEYCTGVLLYRDGLDAFFDKWYDNLDKNIEVYHGDIAAFRQTVWETDVQVASLPAEYNCKPRWAGTLHNDVVILHERLLDIDTMGASKRFDSESVVEKLNSVSGNRCHFPNGGLFEGYRTVDVIPREKSLILNRRFPLSQQTIYFSQKLRKEGIFSTFFELAQSVIERLLTLTDSQEKKRSPQHISVSSPAGRLSLLVDEEDTHISRQHNTEYGYTPGLLSLLHDTIDSDAVFYDIGSKFGYYPLFASKLGLDTNHIHVFEANQSNIWYLKQNIGDKAIIHHSQIGSQHGISIDDYIKNNPSPDVVHINVGGDEAAVLEDMIELLETDVTLLIEYHPQYISNRGHDRLYEILDAAGYSTDMIDHQARTNDLQYLDEPYVKTTYLIHAYKSTS